MKSIGYSIMATIVMTISCSAQQIVNYTTFNDGINAGKYFKDIDNNFESFTGVWEYQNGNQIFRVFLWKELKIEHENGNQPSFYMDSIMGHYELVQINDGQFPLETLVYTSQKKVGQSETYWPHVIRGSSINGINFEGFVRDVSIPFNPIYPLELRGQLELTIVPNTNPVQMHWEVTMPHGIRDPDRTTEFNIPTDIILTKQ